MYHKWITINPRRNKPRKEFVNLRKPIRDSFVNRTRTHLLRSLSAIHLWFVHSLRNFNAACAKNLCQHLAKIKHTWLLFLRKIYTKITYKIIGIRINFLNLNRPKFLSSLEPKSHKDTYAVTLDEQLRKLTNDKRMTHLKITYIAHVSWIAKIIFVDFAQIAHVRSECVS